MKPLWKLVMRRALQLVFSVVVFVYVIAALGDQRFMAIDRVDVQFRALRAATLVAQSQSLPYEEAVRTQDQYQAQFATRYGFDKPFPVRVHMRVVRFVTEGLGESNGFGVVRVSSDGYRHEISHSVTDVIAHAAVPTLLLFGGAFLMQVAIAFYLGLWAARRPGSILDRTTTVAGYLATCVPPFIAAFFVMITFVYAWRVFPGNVWICRWPASWGEVGPWLMNFVSYYTLPFLTLVVIGFGTWAIQFRNIVLTVNREDFVDAARARGLSERRVVYGHVARAASPPLVSAIAMGFVSSLFGCFFVEAVFHWPGIGWLFMQAVNPEPPRAEDKLIFGIMLVTGIFYILASFLLELVYGLLDPRIRASGKA